MAEFKYRALRVKQTDSGNWLVLFGAPAIEIIKWAGVPQKRQLGEGEAVGFQRGENSKRINSLKSFCKDTHNIIQNPLLCATRGNIDASVKFQADEEETEQSFAGQPGWLIIRAEELNDLSLLEILRRIENHLEERVPSLREEPRPDQLITKLKQSQEYQDLVPEEQADEDEDIEEEEAQAGEDDVEAGADIVFSDESHILEFWQDVAARVEVLTELGTSFTSDTFAGFSKEAMVPFLCPIVVVDGQHRLRGAIEAARELSESRDFEEEVRRRINRGDDPDEVQYSIQLSVSRKLPVSLLMTNDPAEHVFQFVVVNQKATPVGPALLGTIVATSLSNDELTRVRDRLISSEIPLEEARAVAYLTRNPQSPFYRLVDRGLRSGGSLLQWTVLVSLVNIFRNLKGGRLYHDPIDNAAVWKREYLAESPIVNGWEVKGYASPFEYWRGLDGPWREVFIHFWYSVNTTPTIMIDL